MGQLQSSFNQLLSNVSYATSIYKGFKKSIQAADERAKQAEAAAQARENERIAKEKEAADKKQRDLDDITAHINDIQRRMGGIPDKDLQEIVEDEKSMTVGDLLEDRTRTQRAKDLLIKKGELVDGIIPEYEEQMITLDKSLYYTENELKRRLAKRTAEKETERQTRQEILEGSIQEPPKREVKKYGK